MDGMWTLKIDEGERWESEDKFNTLEKAVECANKVLTKYNESTDRQKVLQQRKMEDMFDFYPDENKKELHDLIFGWMSKHDYLPSFYKIVNESEEQVE